MNVAKRCLDLILTILGLLVIWPVLFVVALLIKLRDAGPVFFRQERVGRGGRLFRIWKFRTMVVDAEKRGASLTVGQDPRITRMGHWLRKSKLDELPQLFNVLCGEMSLVGPRPEVPRYVAMYTPEQRQVLALTPGITDLASIKYRNESDLLAHADDAERVYIEEVMPEKIAINLEYAKHSHIGSDCAVILNTLSKLFRR